MYERPATVLSTRTIHTGRAFVTTRDRVRLPGTVRRRPWMSFDTKLRSS